LPNLAVALLGLLVMLSVEPDARVPARSVVATRRNVVLGLLAAVALTPIAFEMDLLRWGDPGRVGACGACHPRLDIAARRA
jgi:hypothetical protein